jgi:hypothetical protein
MGSSLARAVPPLFCASSPLCFFCFPKQQSVRSLKNDILTTAQNAVFPLLDQHSADAGAGASAVAYESGAAQHRVVLSVTEDGAGLSAVPVFVEGMCSGFWAVRTCVN